MPQRILRDRTEVTAHNVHEVLGRHMLVDGFHVVIDLEKSRGVWLVDAKTGQTYLDFYSFFASAPLGLNHPKVLTPEHRKRIVRVATDNVTNSDVYTVEMAQFVETLSRTAMPHSLPHLFLVAGGALAVENALKAAFDWKVQKNFAKGIQSETGHKVLHFRNAFHGRSGYTLSLTNTDPVKTRYFSKFNWPRISSPAIEFPLTPESSARVAAAEVTAIAEIEAVVAREGDDIAALIIEPIQGEGGDNHFRGEFLLELRELCTEHDILMIVDEVQAGLGATGKWWSYQHFGFEPDILAFGKKMQVCGIMAGPRLDEVEGVFRVSSRINSTWGGNLVDMVRSQAYLEAIEEEGLVENARVVGDHLLAQLQALAAEFPGLVSAARGRGLMCAFDLPSPEIRKTYLEAARSRGVLQLPCGTRTARFRPALIITKGEIDTGIERIRDALKSL